MRIVRQIRRPWNTSSMTGPGVGRSHPPGALGPFRRWFLVAAGSVVVVAASFGECLGAPEVPGGLRVQMSLDVAGELLAPAGPDAPPVRQPVEMAARFEFTERVSGQAAPGDSPRPVVCRFYREAEATMRVGGVPTTVTLAADARSILVARQGTTPTPYLADGFLSGDEADLLDTPFDPLLLDDLPARRAMAIGATWEIPADICAGLLAIDTLESGGMEARLEEVVDGRAKIAISGIIDGAADGVPTHVTVEGHWFAAAAEVSADEHAAAADPVASAAVFPEKTAFTDAAAEAADATIAVATPRFELHGPVLQVSAVIRERRQASHVAPGFEVEARLSVSREPVDAADVPADVPAACQPPRRRGDGAPGRVWYRDEDGRFDLVYDARWRRVEDGANGLVMRLIDRGALIGQGSITGLSAAADAAAPTPEDVQRDVERSLAGQIARVEAAEEWTRDDGLKVVRVASSGTAGQLPFRWMHYVLADQHGGRVHVTIMCEESLVQRLGDADRQLIGGLRLGAAAGAASPGRARPAAAAAPDGSRLQTR